MNRINQNIERQNVQISAMGAVKSALADFESALKSISESVELVGQKVNAPETEGLVFDQTGRSSAGSYSVEVVSVADRQKNIMTTGVAPGTDLGQGTLRVTNGSGDSVDVLIGSGQGSLDSVAKMINDQSGTTGVTARVMTVKDANGNDVEKLVFESADTGADQSFTVEVVSVNNGKGAGNTTGLEVLETVNMKTLSTASDAEIKVDGERFLSSSNEFNNAVEGVSINVEAPSVGSLITMQIATSSPPIKDKLTAFVEAYNTMMGVIDSKSKPGSEARQNPLENNAMIRQIKNQIRNVITSGIDVGGKTVSLAEMGVMTNASSGKLELNSARMNEFMEVNSSLVKDFFAQESTGLTQRFESVFTPYIQTGGFIDSSRNTAEATISRLNRDLSNHEDRMARFENNLFTKYSKMDALMAQLSSQNNAITAMLSSMSTYG